MPLRRRQCRDWLTLTNSPERRIEGKSAATAFLPNSQSSFPAFLMVAFPRSGTKSTDVLGNFAAAPLEADLVLRPRMDDAHQDHRLLGKMVPMVWPDALVLHYEIPKWDWEFGRSNCYVAFSAGG